MMSSPYRRIPEYCVKICHEFFLPIISISSYIIIPSSHSVIITNSVDIILFKETHIQTNEATYPSTLHISAFLYASIFSSI
jgi:hypothetical protein